MNLDTKVQFAVRIPPEYIERLNDLAEKMQLDRSEVARRAMREGINDLEQTTKVMANPVAEALLKVASLFESDAEQREEVLRVLRSVGEHKKAKKQGGTAAPA